MYIPVGAFDNASLAMYRLEMKALVLFDLSPFKLSVQRAISR